MSVTQNQIGLTYPVASSLGGTGFNAYIKGDLLHASATNTLSKLGIGTLGQVLTVNSSGDMDWENLPSTALGFVSVSGSTQALAVNTAYYTTLSGLTTLTLPSTAAAGTLIEVLAGPGNTFQVAQNALQQIMFGADFSLASVNTTIGITGYIQSTAANSILVIKCVVANTTWMVMNAVNQMTVN